MPDGGVPPLCRQGRPAARGQVHRDVWLGQCSTGDVAEPGSRGPASQPELTALTIWGLRLGYEGEHGVPPADVAEALRREKGRPFVVTLAACDSANQVGAVFAVQSVAQELHRCRVPVVGSQLPLTKTGSLVLVRAFYERLLRGADVRAALHAARVRLRADAEAHHGWLSLVGYVRLPPETYAEHLAEVGVRMELRLLDTAQKRADGLSEHGGTLAEFAAVEQRVRRGSSRCSPGRCDSPTGATWSRNAMASRRARTSAWRSSVSSAAFGMRPRVRRTGRIRGRR